MIVVVYQKEMHSARRIQILYAAKMGAPSERRTPNVACTTLIGPHWWILQSVLLFRRTTFVVCIRPFQAFIRVVMQWKANIQ